MSCTHVCVSGDVSVTQQTVTLLFISSVVMDVNNVFYYTCHIYHFRHIRCCELKQFIVNPFSLILDTITGRF